MCGPNKGRQVSSITLSGAGAADFHLTCYRIFPALQTTLLESLWQTLKERSQLGLSIVLKMLYLDSSGRFLLLLLHGFPRMLPLCVKCLFDTGFACRCGDTNTRSPAKRNGCSDCWSHWSRNHWNYWSKFDPHLNFVLSPPVVTLISLIFLSSWGLIISALLYKD